MAKRDTPGADLIYSAAEQWRNTCLQADGSLFAPGRAAWSRETLDDLTRRFIEAPDTSKDSFMAKFERQLKDAPDATVLLAAETLFVYFLIAESVRGSKKREVIQEVLGWMRDPVVIPEQLGEALNGGLCNPGLSFNTHRPHHIAQIVSFAGAWKKLDSDRQEQLLGDAFAFKAFLEGCRVHTGNTQFHALLHLVHPDGFESIVSPKHKSLIVAAFEDRIEGSHDDPDRNLLEIRRALEDEAGGPVNFYSEELKAQWKAEDQSKPTKFRGPPEDLRGAVERWYPDPAVRKRVLEQLAASIRHAHAVKERSWALNVFPRSIRLNVGRLQVMVLREGVMRVVVDGERRGDGSFDAFVQDASPYKTLPHAVQLEIPADQLQAVEYAVRPAHERLIRQAATTASRSPSAREVFEELFVLLERELGVELPRPAGRSDAVAETPDSEEFDPAAGLEDLEESLLLEQGSLERVVQLLTDKPQAVFYGPPGTGKTFVARKLADHVARDGGSVTLVQFHPSYSYEDFVEGFRPTLDGDTSGFALREGPLRRAAQQARLRPDRKHVLVIDELNRGNLAKVFGELYFLLEYRDEELQLQYSDSTFSLPENLWILGTMNTADRSIALVDLALRRRFRFVPFFPDQAPIQGLLGRWLTANAPDMLWVADVVDLANRKLQDRDTAIGPSYFLREDFDDEWLELTWTHAVLPYLAERFVGDEDRLAEFELAQLRRELEREVRAAESGGDGASSDF